MSSWTWKAGVAGAAVLAATVYAFAQMAPGHSGMHGQMQDSMHGRMHDQMRGSMQGGHGMHGGMGQHGMMGQRAAGEPTMPGQDAFGAIQEVVQILEADPKTDWSKVNIAALREHLIDMNEVTLHAVANQRPLENGVEIDVTGQGRTLAAIKRMVPAHVRELDKLGWNAKTDNLPDGVKLVVTSTDPARVTRLKALGFMGIMVQGGHHQPHHLMIAKGEFHAH
jgi:hypothetical protein